MKTFPPVELAVYAVAILAVAACVYVGKLNPLELVATVGIILARLSPSPIAAPPKAEPAKETTDVS